MLYPWKKIKSHFWQKGNTVYGFKTTTKLKLVERSEGLRVLTLLAVVASPRTGGVQGCRLAAAADPEITPEHQSCRHLASTNPPATSTVRITGPGHSQARWIFCGLPSDGEEAGSTKYQLRNHIKVWGKSMYSSLVVIWKYFLLKEPCSVLLTTAWCRGNKTFSVMILIIKYVQIFISNCTQKSY